MGVHPALADGQVLGQPSEGEALEPLYKTAAKAAQRDPKLYECLALIDAIRSGRARERKLAEQHLRNILGHGG